MEKKDSSRKRQVAFKVRIKDIINGKYIKEEGWEPNYVLIGDNFRVSRINLIGTVVAKSFEEASYDSLMLDDGSARIYIRDFRENKILDSVDVGDIVMLIGRPREYGSEKYIVPEILKKVSDDRWIEVRKLELQKLKIAADEDFKEMEKSEEYIEEIEEKESMLLTQKIYNSIKELDKGNGVDTGDIIKLYGASAERIVENFLKEGEIFEIRPGMVKVLE